MDILFIVQTLLLLVSWVMIFLMFVRIKQLEREVNNLDGHRVITDEELERLAKDIEEFKKINISDCVSGETTFNFKEGGL